MGLIQIIKNKIKEKLLGQNKIEAEEKPKEKIDNSEGEIKQENLL